MPVEEISYIYIAAVIFISAITSLFSARRQMNSATYIYLSSILGIFLFSMCIPPILAKEFYFPFPLPQYGTRISRDAAVIVLVIGLTLSIFSIWLVQRTKSYAENKEERRIVCRKRPLLDIIIITILIPLSIYGYWSGILAVGLEPRFILPLRLNGIIEYVMLVFIPIYLAFLTWSRKIPFIISLILIAIYAAINLYLTGSKWAALLPVLVSLLFFLYIKAPLKNVLWFILIGIFAYTILNPFMFRLNLQNNVDLNLIESFVESTRSRQSASFNFFEQFLTGIYFLSSRLNGFFPLVWALDIVKFADGMVLDVYGYVNSVMIGNSSIGTGMFGFFIIFFDSAFIGVTASLCMIFIFYWINQRLEFSDFTIFGPVAFCSSIMPFIMLGRVQYLGTYLGVCVILVLVILLERLYGVSIEISN